MSVKTKTDMIMLTKISNIIMELSKVDSLNTCYKALSEIIKEMVDIEEEYFFNKDDEEKIYEIFDKEHDESIEELVKWSFKKTEVSIFPEEKGSYIVMPITQSTKVNFVYTIFTSQQEFSNRFMMILRITTFLLGNLFETLVLYEDILDKNIIIEKNKNFLNNILNSTIDSIAVYDEAKNIQFSNDNYKNLIEDKNFKEIIELEIKKALEEKSNKTFEKFYEEKTFSVDILNIKFENDYYILINMRDISGTKELEKLKKIDKMKNEFISTMSHELRTPLASIKAYSETIFNSLEALDKDTLTEFMKTILTESEHLENLLNNVLDFSKLETHSLDLEKSKFNLIELIKEVTNSLKDLSQDKKVDIVNETEIQKLEVYLDKVRIKQALANLIQNALKYSDNNKEQKKVIISLEDNDEKIKIIIEDNGIGIPEQEIPKIYDKFYRVDSSLTYEVQGTGIGLSIVKEIIETHDGSIEAESELGKGTKFTIEIPKEMVE